MWFHVCLTVSVNEGDDNPESEIQLVWDGVEILKIHEFGPKAFRQPFWLNPFWQACAEASMEASAAAFLR